jgi:hypothetical protein
MYDLHGLAFQYRNSHNCGTMGNIGVLTQLLQNMFNMLRNYNNEKARTFYRSKRTARILLKYYLMHAVIICSWHVRHCIHLGFLVGPQIKVSDCALYMTELLPDSTRLSLLTANTYYCSKDKNCIVYDSRLIGQIFSAMKFVKMLIWFLKETCF